MASSIDNRNNASSIRDANKQQHKFTSKNVFNKDKTWNEGISLLTQAEEHVKCEKKIDLLECVAKTAVCRTQKRLGIKSEDVTRERRTLRKEKLHKCLLS